MNWRIQHKINEYHGGNIRTRVVYANEDPLVLGFMESKEKERLVELALGIVTDV